MTSSNVLEHRIAEVERRIRRCQLILFSVVVVVPVLSLWVPKIGAQGSQGEIRARTLVIEDANGRERIVFGAPIREAPGRISASTGFKIWTQLVPNASGWDSSTTVRCQWVSTRRQARETSGIESAFR